MRTGASTGNYFAIVEYVYPNTPASNAGFIRGDIIIKIDGGNITADNYMKLLFQQFGFSHKGNPDHRRYCNRSDGYFSC